MSIQVPLVVCMNGFSCVHMAYEIKAKIQWGLEIDHYNLEPLQISDVFDSPILNGKKQDGRHFGSVFE